MGGGSSFLVSNRQTSVHQPEDTAKPAQKSVVFVIGAPGAGKENFCAQLADKFDISYLVVENLLKQRERQLSDASARDIVMCLYMMMFNSMQDQFIM